MQKKFLVTLLLLILGFFFYQTKRAQLSLWDRESRFSFVLAPKASVVVSLQPGKNLTALKLPDSLYLETPHGFGQYQLGSVYELGELEGKGGELLRETVQAYLGVPIDGYIKVQSSKFKVQNDKKFILNSIVLSMRGRGETNLSKWVLLRLWWEIQKLRSDKVKFIGLKETNILGEKSLPDGSSVLETEFFRLDELVKKFFSDSKIEKEGIQIEVLNATDHPGLANRLARLVTNMGGEVIAMGNSNIKYQISNIKFREKRLGKSYTIRKLEKILGVEAEMGEMGESRADLLILAGEDYWEMVK